MCDLGHTFADILTHLSNRWLHKLVLKKRHADKRGSILTDGHKTQQNTLYFRTFYFNL